MLPKIEYQSYVSVKRHLYAYEMGAKRRQVNNEFTRGQNMPQANPMARCGGGRTCESPESDRMSSQTFWWLGR